MFAVVINDSWDDNAMARQAVRTASFLGCSVTTLGVSSDLEAAGNLVDVLDASLGGLGAVLVNVAPRSGAAKQWENGSPFCYFFYENTLVAGTFDGESCSLAAKLGLVNTVKLLDTRRVLRDLASRGLITPDLVGEISNSQFRSFEFLPRVAAWLLKGVDLPSEETPVGFCADSAARVWLVDCFGNAKTTALPDEAGFKDGRVIESNIGRLNCYTRLADVPDGEAAFIVGSSGIGKNRFLEIVVQGASAAERFGLEVGSIVL